MLTKDVQGHKESAHIRVCVWWGGEQCTLQIKIASMCVYIHIQWKCPRNYVSLFSREGEEAGREGEESGREGKEGNGGRERERGR